MDGRACSSKIKESLKEKVESMKGKGMEPVLATILVGDDPSSKLYVGSKHKVAAEIGISSKNFQLPSDAKPDELKTLISELNADETVDGILLQLPIPKHLDSRQLIEGMSPDKDVDGLTSTNMGRLVNGEPFLVPCTPLGVVELLHQYSIPMSGKNVVIINRSSLVGKPLFHLLLREDATVTICHSKSRNIASFTTNADMVVTAVGQRPPFTLIGEMVKEGAVVVDVATNRVEGKLVGDADFDGVSKKASYITPVPGGIGPMTVIMLMSNTLKAALARRTLGQ